MIEYQNERDILNNYYSNVKNIIVKDYSYIIISNYLNEFLKFLKLNWDLFKIWNIICFQSEIDYILIFRIGCEHAITYLQSIKSTLNFREMWLISEKRMTAAI